MSVVWGFITICFYIWPTVLFSALFLKAILAFRDLSSFEFVNNISFSVHYSSAMLLIFHETKQSSLQFVPVAR